MFGGIRKLVGALGTIRKIAVGTLLIGGVGKRGIGVEFDKFFITWILLISIPKI